MSEIIQASHRDSGIEYKRSFVWRKDPGSGFGFPCDARGKVKETELQPAAWENFIKCVLMVYDVIDKGVSEWHWSTYTPPLLRCDCGKEFYLDDAFATTCPKCGADYNGCGQRLAPRRFWGEETGESLADIFALDPEEIY